MKKVIALLLSVLMLLSIAPVAFADEAIDDETTTVAEAADNVEESDNSLSAAGDLFGGFFVKIGEMLRIVFEFLANLFNGTGSSNIDKL